MILRRHCGAALLLIICFSATAFTDVLDDDVRSKREANYQSDPKAYLDEVIAHWIFKIPFLLDESVDQSEKDLRLTVAKKVTQGWSIVIGSWKDIYSDFVGNNRTLGNLGNMGVVYNYGFLFTYGIGFGFPLLLGLPDDKKGCGRDDFLRALYDYGLQGGITQLLDQGASPSDVQSILIEFERVVGTRLSCIDSSENIESQVASNAVANLLTAMNTRLGLEEEGRRRNYISSSTFKSRRLSVGKKAAVKRPNLAFEEALPDKALLVQNQVLESV